MYTRIRSTACAFGAAALALAMPTNAQEEVVIGFAVAQSGWMEAYDGPPLTGAMMAIEDYNAAGGILGKTIRAVVADTKTDTVQGAKAGTEVVAKGAHFMVVSCDYDMGAPAATVAHGNDMIAISFCASDAKMGVQGIGPYAFTMNTPGQNEGAIAAAYGWEQGWRKAYAILDASIEYNKSVCHGFLEYWKTLGGEVIGVDTFMQEDPSIASQITRYKQAAADMGEPEILALCSYVPGAVSAIRQLRGAGVEAAIVSGDAMDGHYWAEGVPGLSDHYAVTFGSIYGDDPRPEVNDFFARYRAQFGEPETSFPLNGYSVVQAIKIAAERAGSLDNDKVLAEMNKFNKQPLLWGATSFEPEMHIDRFHPMTVIQIQDGEGSYAATIGLDDPPALKLIFPEFTADLYD